MVMPSRLLREGILDSEAVNVLSFPAEVFYRRLMSAVDDFGRFDGRPSVLRSRLYPLKVNVVREADITRWIAECEKAGLIALYTVDSKPYVLFGKLGPARAKESKFPAPSTDTTRTLNRLHPFTSENGCAQMKSDAPYSYSGTDSDSDSDYCSEPSQTPASEPPVMTFPTVGDGPKEWHLTASKLSEYGETFPGVDLLGELRKARQWCIDNTARRKTAKGMPKFCSGWLTKAQNSGSYKAVVPTLTASNPPLDPRESLRHKLRKEVATGIKKQHEAESEFGGPLE
jgi:hypothetical protein